MTEKTIEDRLNAIESNIESMSGDHSLALVGLHQICRELVRLVRDLTTVETVSTRAIGESGDLGDNAS